jgi:hypothetical protein
VAWIQRLKRTDGTTSYKVYWRDPSRKMRTKTYRTRKNADRWIREVEHQKDVGTYVDPNLGKDGKSGSPRRVFQYGAYSRSISLRSEGDIRCTSGSVAA